MPTPSYIWESCVLEAMGRCQELKILFCTTELPLQNDPDIPNGWRIYGSIFSRSKREPLANLQRVAAKVHIGRLLDPNGEDAYRRPCTITLVSGRPGAEPFSQTVLAQQRVLRMDTLKAQLDEQYELQNDTLYPRMPPLRRRKPTPFFGFTGPWLASYAGDPRFQ